MQGADAHADELCELGLADAHGAADTGRIDFGRGGDGGSGKLRAAAYHWANLQGHA
jgi:hypothetical protein